MDREMRLCLFIIALTIILTLLLFWFFKNRQLEKESLAQLKRQYEEAIVQRNKSLALKLGREYYGRLRGGRLSTYDEQAIANDLSTIDSIEAANPRQ